MPRIFNPTQPVNLGGIGIDNRKFFFSDYLQTSLTKCQPGQLYATLGVGERTPLMLAASICFPPLVKLLFEPPYSADDALIAKSLCVR